MNEPRKHGWLNKFRVAARGVLWTLRTQSSFKIHVIAAIAVVIAAVALGASRSECGVLGLCITLVLFAEVINTALEHLARAITREHNPDIGHALDAASGAVLIAAGCAAVIGAGIFLNRLRLWLEY